MMPEIGTFSLYLCFIVTAYATVATLVGAIAQERRMIASAEACTYSSLGLLTIVSAALIHALVTRNFEIEYVYHYSDKALPLFYTITAFWAGQEGSILLWAWMLSLFAVIVVIQNRHTNRELMPYVTAVIMVTCFFFVAIMVFVTNPFSSFHFKPPDGNGLNPLLQNPGMIWHPPTLYLGYVGFTVPFAFAIAAMITGKLDDSWIKSTRRWTLFSWIFLTIGIILGAQWAYVELGWGGYWAWDPVENASLMPWLTGTAYLHSMIIQEKRNMLKTWNIALISLTFILSIFGTFITRSGIISSVHSFGESTLGPLFMVFLLLTIAISILLVTRRWETLKSENELDSLLSRESTFLYNNLILVAICLVVFVGTVWPFIYEMAKGSQATVTAAYFDRINVPIGLALLILIGICPLVGWRKTSAKNLKRSFLLPGAISLISVIMLFIAGIRRGYPLTCAVFSIFVTVTILMEFYRGTHARCKVTGENPLLALGRLINKNRRRYGGYIVHIGVVLIYVGLNGSTAYKVEKEVSLKQGEDFTIGDYTLKFQSFSQYPTESKITNAAIVPVYKAGKKIDVLTPEKNIHYKHANQPVTEVSIHWNLKEDLYLILAGVDNNDRASFKAVISPLVVWLWIGGTVMTLGGVVAIWPDKKRYRAG
jgi:cytochrome c-type biogenesis protein CcmF